MSYIPDYRNEIEKLSKDRQNFAQGYHAAIEDAVNFFSNLDVYYGPEAKIEVGVLEDAEEHFKAWMDVEEIEAVCALFDAEGTWEPDEEEAEDGK